MGEVAGSSRRTVLKAGFFAVVTSFLAGCSSRMGSNPTSEPGFSTTTQQLGAATYSTELEALPYAFGLVGEIQNNEELVEQARQILAIVPLEVHNFLEVSTIPSARTFIIFGTTPKEIGAAIEKKVLPDEPLMVAKDTGDITIFMDHKAVKEEGFSYLILKAVSTRLAEVTARTTESEKLRKEINNQSGGISLSGTDMTKILGKLLAAEFARKAASLGRTTPKLYHQSVEEARKSVTKAIPSLTANKFDALQLRATDYVDALVSAGRELPGRTPQPGQETIRTQGIASSPVKRIPGKDGSTALRVIA